MIDFDAFAFIERCSSYGETRPLLDDLLFTASQFGFEHLIVAGVTAAGQKPPSTAGPRDGSPATSNAATPRPTA